MADTFAKGVKDVTRRVRYLDEKAGPKVMSKAVSAGTTPVAAAIRKAAPKDKTNKSKDYRLSKAVGKRTKKKKGHVVSARVGLNIAKKGTKRAPHAPLVTLGTKRRRTGSGANRGRMPANRFVRTATRASGGAARAKMNAKAVAEADKLILEARGK